MALVAARAGAEPPAPASDRVTFRAGRVSADAALTDVTLEEGVELRRDRVRVTSERLRLGVDPGGVTFEGDAKLALCPCPDPPLTLTARGGRLDRTGDLKLRWPRIELWGLPVFGLPWIWIRPPDQPGLLPPIIALRSSDGLLLGGGVHLPWRGGEGALRALDLTAAGFTSGGVELGASLATRESRARIVVDLVHGTRVAVDARGAIAASGPWAMAWQVDAIRGDRGRSLTVDLAPASQPFDTGAMEASIRARTGAVSAIAAGALIARAMRDEGPIAAGPRATLAAGGAIAQIGSWSADASGVVLGGAAEGAGVPIARASASAEIDARPGPMEVRVSAGARARYAGELAASSSEGAGAARIEASMPLVRTFQGKPGEAALAHWITPVITARGALADVRGSFFAPIEGRVPATSWIAAAGVWSALGRYAGPAIRVDATLGATGDRERTAQAMMHARAGVDARIAALAIEAAAVGDRAGRGAAASARGHAILGRGRVGYEDGPWLRVEVSEQDGAGAGQARAIASGAWAALPGDELAYLASSGITFGAEISVPWTRAIRTGARGDVDLASGRLLSVRGLVAYAHACGCLGLGLAGAHRAGRPGADVALTVDVTPQAERRTRF